MATQPERTPEQLVTVFNELLRIAGEAGLGAELHKVAASVSGRAAPAIDADLGQLARRWGLDGPAWSGWLRDWLDAETATLTPAPTLGLERKRQKLLPRMHLPGEVTLEPSELGYVVVRLSHMDDLENPTGRQIEYLDDAPASIALRLSGATTFTEAYRALRGPLREYWQQQVEPLRRLAPDYRARQRSMADITTSAVRSYLAWALTRGEAPVDLDAERDEDLGRWGLAHREYERLWGEPPTVGQMQADARRIGEAVREIGDSAT